MLEIKIISVNLMPQFFIFLPKRTVKLLWNQFLFKLWCLDFLPTTKRLSKNSKWILISYVDRYSTISQQETENLHNVPLSLKQIAPYEHWTVNPNTTVEHILLSQKLKLLFPHNHKHNQPTKQRITSSHYSDFQIKNTLMAWSPSLFNTDLSGPIATTMHNGR